MFLPHQKISIYQKHYSSVSEQSEVSCTETLIEELTDLEYVQSDRDESISDPTSIQLDLCNARSKYINSSSAMTKHGQSTH